MFYVWIFFWSAQEISDGEVNIDLKLDQEPLQLTVGLCEALQQIGESCPIKQGPGTFNVTTTIPDTTPVSDVKIVAGYGMVYCALHPYA